MNEEWTLDTRRLGKRVLVFDHIDSTNQVAATLAGQPENEGLAILADEQSAGRGQHGRSWVAPSRSSVLLSLILRPPPPLCRPALLTAWAAVAVCEVVRRTTNIQPRIKWPNDVFMRGRKVCGILLEQSQHRSGTATVAGIGLNVTQTDEEFASAGLPLATSLRAHVPDAPDTRAVARMLIAQLDEDYDRMCQGDLATLEACWKWRLGLLGRDVVAECADGVRQGRLLEIGFSGIVLASPERGAIALPPEMILHLSRA
jgi:BirA family biotin operon repressor/biotin-[acetyl-CoA-carboxylase] ligase